jgi:hypothetical protein
VLNLTGSEHAIVDEDAGGIYYLTDGNRFYWRTGEEQGWLLDPSGNEIDLVGWYETDGACSTSRAATADEAAHWEVVAH